MELSSADLPLVPIRRGIKRSASTASLPTPPRTHRRRGRGRSRGSCDSDSDSDKEGVVLNSSSDEEQEDDGLPQISGHKKRRLNDDKDEDDFWLAGPDSKVDDPKVNASDKSIPLIYRKSQTTRGNGNGLASPPPSNRKSQSQVVTPITPPILPSSSSTSTIPIPVTPKKQTSLFNRFRKRAKSPEFPIISNSPDNPFYVASSSLSSPDNNENDVGEEASSSPTMDSSPLTPTPIIPSASSSTYMEKPTVTYVFRGIRKEFHNPMYNHAENRPMSPPPTTLLPIEHPDFSPDIGCKPTVLFSDELKGKAKAKAKGKGKGKAKGKGVKGKGKVVTRPISESEDKEKEKEREKEREKEKAISDSEFILGLGTLDSKSSSKSKSRLNMELKLAPAPSLSDLTTAPAPAPALPSVPPMVRRSPRFMKNLQVPGRLFGTKVNEEDEEEEVEVDELDSDDGDGDIGTLIKPKKLDFGPPKMRSVNVDVGVGVKKINSTTTTSMTRKTKTSASMTKTKTKMNVMMNTMS